MRSSDLIDFNLARHLAQVFADGEVVGTPLDGASLGSTLNSVLGFLTWINTPDDDDESQVIANLAKKSFGAKPDGLHNLGELIKRLENWYVIYQKLDEIIDKYKDLKSHEEQEEKLSEALQALGQSLIEEAKGKGEIFIPGGWAGPDGNGHSMLYRLKFKENGRAVFYIYNTGGGAAEYHSLAPLPSGKQGHYPVYAFSFSHEDKPSKLSTFLAELFKIQILPELNENRSYDANWLYEKIIMPAYQWLEKTQKIPARELAQPILGQRGGSCAYKTTMLLVQEHFPNKPASRGFVLAYRLYLLKKNLKPEYLAEQGYHELMEHGLANAARMLDKRLKSRRTAVDLEGKTEQAIHGILDNFNKILGPDSRFDRSARVKTIDPCEPNKVPSFKAYSYSFLENLEDKTADFEEKSRDRILYSLNNKPFLEALTDLNKLEIDNEEFVHAIEDFCYAFSDARFSLLNEAKPDQQVLLSEMKVLLERYKKCRPQATPRSIVIYTSLMFLMDRLCEEGAFRGQTKTLSCLPLSADQLSKPFLQRLVHNPLLSSFDPQIDALLGRINDYYLKKAASYPQGLAAEEKSKEEFRERALNYYCSIIADAAPEERKLIEEEWRKENQGSVSAIMMSKIMPKRGDLHYCYSYLIKPNTISEKTPLLNKTFSLQNQIEGFILNCLSPIAVKCIRSHKREMRANGDYWGAHTKRPFEPGKSAPGLEVTLSSSSNERNLTFNTWLFEDVSAIHHEDFRSEGESWLLNPKLLEYFCFTDSGVRNALISHYDGNPYQSRELRFNSQVSSFCKNNFITAKQRQNAEDYHASLRSRSKQDRLETFLQLLNISSRCQAILLLSELSVQATWVNDEELQQYIELNLFQPGVLLEALNSGGSSLSFLLDRVLKQNRFNSDPAYPEKTEWFLLKLAAKVSAYALEAEQLGLIKLDETGRNEFQTWHKTMLAALAARLKEGALSLEEQREAYSLRLVSLHCADSLSSWEEDPALKDELLLESYLRFIFTPKPEKIGGILEEERMGVLIKKTYSYLSLKMSQDPDFPIMAATLLAKIMREHRQNSDWQVTEQGTRFPQIRVDDQDGNQVEVDLRLQTIKENNHETCYLPLSLRLKPEYRELFNSQPFLATKTKLLSRYNVFDCYTFIGRPYRVLFSENNALLYFQKQIDGVWHTLKAPSNKIRSQIGFFDFAFTENLPPLFNQSAYRVWVANEDQYKIENSLTGTVDYSYKKGELIKYEKGQPVGRVGFASEEAEPHPPLALLLQIESQKFIEKITGEDKSIRWFLPRYGLTFYQSEDGGLVLHDKNEQYQVEEKPNAAEACFGTGLILKPLKARQQEAFLLVPLQPFYFQPEDKSEILHHQWVHDFSNYLAEKALAQKSATSPMTGSGWAYTNSETAVRFPLVKGKFNARSAADKIYLAYLHLAQDRPLEAFKILSNCQFQGTREEIRRLWWFLAKLPANTSKPLENSKVLAVQTKALHALITIKKDYPEAIKKPAKLASRRSDTENYRYLEENELSEFLASLKANGAKLLEAYDNYFNNIPTQLRLNKQDHLFLLSHYQMLNQEEHKGVLGTRYLEHFSHSLPKITHSLYPSREPIQLGHPINKNRAYFSNHFSFYFLEEMSLGFSIPLEEAKALAALSPWMPLRTLARYFPSYCQLALGKNQDAKRELDLFCQGAIMRYSGDPAAKDSTFSEVILLIELLWTMLKNPQKWNNLPHWQAGLSSRLLNCSKNDDKHTELSNFLKKLIENLKETSVCSIPMLTMDSFNIFHGGKQEEKAPAFRASLPPELKLDELSLDTFPASCLELRKFLQEEEQKYEERRKAIVKSFNNLPSLTLEEQQAEFNKIDHLLLEAKKELLQIQEKQVAETKFGEAEILALIETEQELSRQIDGCKKNLEDILKRRQKPLIAEIGKQMEAPTVENLIANYAKADKEAHKRQGIQETDLPGLESNLKNYFHLNNTLIRASALRKAIEEDKEQTSPQSKQKIIASLLRENRASRKHELVFQYIKGLTLYAEQAHLLSLLAEPEQAASYVIQLIMGGGKTKVLLPLLLYFLAEAGASPIVMIPEMLLKTCFADLQATSLSAFQQTAFLFHFDRESPADPAALRHLFESMDTAFKEKAYMVTAPSSVKSLQLKYLEILFYRAHPEKNLIGSKTVKNKGDSEEQLFWLEKILKRWREATAVPDEVHQLFHIRKDLNYGIGKPAIINSDIVDGAVELYAWLNDEKFGAKLEGLIRNPNQLSKEGALEEFCEFYITALGEEKSQPIWLKPLLAKGLDLATLQGYLRGGLAEEKRVLEALHDQPFVKSRWVLLREEFLTFLPLTLRQKLHENYGPDTGPQPKSHAIVYRANNVPTPFVFANFLETINYTCQMLHGDGVPFETFKAVLVEWQNEARFSRSQTPDMVSDSEKIFNYIFKENEFKEESGFDLRSLELRSLKLNEPEFVAQLHQKFKHHPLLIEHALKEILGTLTLDPALLRSDALNLASMFKRIIAFSGTPSNYRCYHPKLQMNLESGLLIESQVKDYLKCKQTEVKELKGKEPSEFLESCVRENDRIRAILDCGGHLRGKSNLEVAKKLAEILHRTRPKIRFVLFYLNDDLCAWDVSQGENQIPRKLTNTDIDTINDELDNSTPDERFTYGDQEHTVGMDLKQAGEACAILTADIKTGISAFIQAAMRMRGLGSKQTVVIALDHALSAVLEKKDSESGAILDSLFKIFERTQQQQLKEDHFRAALQKITNFFRDDLLIKLMDAASPQQRDDLFLAAEEFFIEYQTDDLLKLYQNKKEMRDTKDILEEHAAKLAEKWSIAVKKYYSKKAAGEAEEKQAGQKIIEDVNKTISEALLICAEKQPYLIEQSGREVQQQKEVEVQVQQQQEVEMVTCLYGPALKLRKLNLNPEHIVNLAQGKSGGDTSENLAQLMLDYKQDWTFDRELFASPNYLYTFSERQAKSDIFNFHSEPGCILYFAYVGDQAPHLTCTILCPEEAQLMHAYLANQRGLAPKGWLTTLKGDELTRAPEMKEVEKNKVSRLLEQAAYLSGRANLLSSLSSFSWLKENSAEKMLFFQDKIKPIFSVTDEQFKRLSSKVHNIEIVIEYWAKHPPEFKIANWPQSLPKEVELRLNKILTCLTEARKQIIEDKSEPVEIGTLVRALVSQGFILQDALLVGQYRNTLLLLRYLEQGELLEAANLFKKDSANFSNGFFDYYFSQGVVKFNSEDNQVILGHLKDNPKAIIAWITQLSSANSSLDKLSPENMAYALQLIPADQHYLCFKPTIAAKARKIATGIDINEFYKFVDQLADQPTALSEDKDKNIIKVLSSFSEYKLANPELVLEVILDPDFCDFMAKLPKPLPPEGEPAHLKYANLFAALLGEWKTNKAAFKKRLSKFLKPILDHKAGEISAYLHGLTKTEHYTAALLLHDKLIGQGVNDINYVIRALADPRLVELITLLRRCNKVEPGYLYNTSREPIFSALLLLKKVDQPQELVSKLLVSDNDLASFLLKLNECFPFDKAIKLFRESFHYQGREISGTEGLKRLKYLTDKKLVNELESEAGLLGSETHWETIFSLQEQKLDDSKKLIKQALRGDPELPKNIKLLSDFGLKDRQLLEALERDEADLYNLKEDLSFLEEAKLLNEARDRLLATPVVQIAVSRLRKDATLRQDFGLANFHGFRRAYKLLLSKATEPEQVDMFFTKRAPGLLDDFSKLIKDDETFHALVFNDASWDVFQSLLKALSKQAVISASLLKQAVSDKALQGCIQLLTQRFSGKPLLKILEKRGENPALLQFILELKDLPNGVMENILTSDDAWFAASALREEKVENENLFTLASASPPFQEMARFLVDPQKTAGRLGGGYDLAAILKLYGQAEFGRFLFLFERKISDTARLEVLNRRLGLDLIGNLEAASISHGGQPPIPIFPDPVLEEILTQPTLQKQAAELFEKQKNDLPNLYQILAFLKSKKLLNTANIAKLLNDMAWENIDGLIKADDSLKNDPALISDALNNFENFKCKLTLLNYNLKGKELLQDFASNEALRKKLLESVELKAEDKTSNFKEATLNAIRAVNQVRNSYNLDDKYAKHLPCIQAFTQQAFLILMNHDQESNRERATKSIEKELREAAKKHFKHRHFAARFVADVLMCLTIIGFLVVGSIRYLIGKHPFFSRSPTDRERRFKEAAGIAKPKPGKSAA